MGNASQINTIANRIAITRPVARDRVSRPSSIPASVLAKRAAKKRGEAVTRRKTLKDIEVANGGPGIFNFSHRNHWHLTNPEWKFDVVPEIMDGKNIADFVDPEIEARLLELEEEEIDLLEEAEQNADEDMDSDLDEETKNLAAKIVSKKKKIIAEGKIRRTQNKPILPRRARNRTRTLESAEKDLQELGLDTTKFGRRARSRSRPKRKRGMDEF